MKTTRRTAKLLTFGRGGHSVEYGTVREAWGDSKSTLSGYETPESWTPEKASADGVPDGCPVIDYRPNPYAVISGPMVDVDLAPGTVDGFTDADRKTAAMMLPGMSGGFAQLATVAQAKEYGGLDRVSVDLYCAYYRTQGCRIGIVADGRLVWEGGAR